MSMCLGVATILRGYFAAFFPSFCQFSSFAELLSNINPFCNYLGLIGRLAVVAKVCLVN